MPVFGTRTRASALSFFLSLFVLFVSFVVPSVRSAEKPKALVFCAEPAAMPRTGKAADESAQGLDVTVARLRSKLRDLHIETIRNVCYVLREA